VNRKILHLALVAVAAAGCNQSAAKPITIQTATIQRRNITVTAEATGIIEPINVIEVKSKTASGQVMQMPIEIGTHVVRGDLIVQIDTTDIHTKHLQAISDLAAAQSNFDVAKAVLERQQQLFAEKIITKPDLESAQTSFANNQATLLRNQAALTQAEQSIKDARVVATVEGTIITKPVSVGQVIQAGGGSVSGGSVIATMADLTKVRARALVNETDIGQVAAGQTATVTIDAFPDRPFQGIVEKIEPSATVQQNVTMFPVLISLNNSEGLLRPGMNGEVAVLTDEREDALAIPNDAIRSTREARQAATILGMNPDSVAAKVGGGGAGGRGGGRAANGGNGNGGQKGVQVQVNRGELDLPLQGGGDPQGAARQGGGRRGGGFKQVEVTDADCKKVDDARKKNPAVVKKIDDLRAKMRDQGADRQAMMADMRKLYADMGTDMQVSGACQRRSEGGTGAGQAGGGRGRGGQGGGGNFTRGQGGRGGGGAGGAGGGGARNANSNRGPRTGLVFVQAGTTWDARILRLGVANYDFTEVLSDNLKEGDKVAMLSAAALQATRQAQIDRQKAGASPFGNAPQGPGGGGPGRGGGGGRGGP